MVSCVKVCVLCAGQRETGDEVMKTDVMRNRK